MEQSIEFYKMYVKALRSGSGADFVNALRYFSGASTFYWDEYMQGAAVMAAPNFLPKDLMIQFLYNVVLQYFNKENEIGRPFPSWIMEAITNYYPRLSEESWNMSKDRNKVCHKLEKLMDQLRVGFIHRIEEQIIVEVEKEVRRRQIILQMIHFFLCHRDLLGQWLLILGQIEFWEIAVNKDSQDFGNLGIYHRFRSSITQRSANELADFIVDIYGLDATDVIRKWQEETEEDLFENPTPEQDQLIDNILVSDISARDKVAELLQSGIFTDNQLRLLACKWAEEALIRERESGREPDSRLWKAIEVGRRFVDGKATKKELDDARVATIEAARHAARVHVRDFAMGITSADIADARSAARSVTWAMDRSAVRSAIGSAAWSAARFDVSESFITDIIAVIEDIRVQELNKQLEEQHSAITAWQKETEEDLFENPTLEQDQQIDNILASDIAAQEKVERLLQSGIFIDNQLRLLACKWAEKALLQQREVELEPDRRSWEAIDVARRFAYGEATVQELKNAHKAASDAAWEAIAATRNAVVDYSVWLSFREAAGASANVTIAESERAAMWTANSVVGSKIADIDANYHKLLLDIIALIEEIREAEGHIVAKWSEETEEDLFENPCHSLSKLDLISSPDTCRRSNSEVLSVDDFSSQLRQLLHRKKVFAIIDKYNMTVGTTWTSGGCWALAYALQQWLGPDAKMVALLFNGKVDHVLVQVGDWYIDADGAKKADDLLWFWAEEERYYDDDFDLQIVDFEPYQRSVIYSLENMAHYIPDPHPSITIPLLEVFNKRWGGTVGRNKILNILLS